MSDEDKLFALTLAALSNNAITGAISSTVYDPTATETIARRCVAVAKRTLKQLKENT